MTEPTPAIDDPLENILRLAASERAARESGLWKTDMEAAFEAHSEAVENLYDALYALLEQRADIGDPVPKKRLPIDPRKELRRQITARLKQEIPSMVAAVIDEF